MTWPVCRRLVGGQEQHGVGQVVGLADAGHERVLGDLFEHLGRTGALGGRRADHAGRHGVAADPVAPVGRRHRHGELVHAGLRRRVRRLRHVTGQALVRRRVDIEPVPAASMCGIACLQPSIASTEIDGERVVPGLDGHRVDGPVVQHHVGGSCRRRCCRRCAGRRRSPRSPPPWPPPTPPTSRRPRRRWPVRRPRRSRRPPPWRRRRSRSATATDGLAGERSTVARPIPEAATGDDGDLVLHPSCHQLPSFTRFELIGVCIHIPPSTLMTWPVM